MADAAASSEDDEGRGAFCLTAFVCIVFLHCLLWRASPSGIRSQMRRLG
jgi:hypothetical protein